MTTATEDQITEEIRVDWRPVYIPRRALQPKRHWAYTALIETAAALIFLVTTIGAGIFYYPLLADWLGDWALLVCAVCAVTYGIITIASVKILKDW